MGAQRRSEPRATLQKRVLLGFRSPLVLIRLQVPRIRPVVGKRIRVLERGSQERKTIRRKMGTQRVAHLSRLRRRALPRWFRARVVGRAQIPKVPLGKMESLHRTKSLAQRGSGRTWKRAVVAPEAVMAPEAVVVPAVPVVRSD